MKRIEVHTDTPTEFELGDTTADIHMGGRRGNREREEEAQRQQTEERHEERRAETPR